MVSPRKQFKHSSVSLGYSNLEDSTTSSGRVYVTPDGKKYPSITTVLGVRGKEALYEWRRRVGEEEANRIARHAATRGSALHSIAERYLNNEETYFAEGEMPHVKGMFNTIRPLLDKHIDEIVMQECPLYSDYLGIAGRVDLVGRFDGRISIIDFKTSSRVKTREEISNYFVQTAAYAIMFEERTQIPVSQLVIVMAVENSSTPLLFVEKRDSWTDELLSVIKEYNTKKNIWTCITH
jgi:genome maintenance exonuclease 1